MEEKKINFFDSQSIPKINKKVVELDNSEWTLSYNEDFQNKILDSNRELDSDVKNIFLDLIKGLRGVSQEHSSRHSLCIKTIPFKVIVNIKNNEILLASSYLGTELFIMKEILKLPQNRINKYISSDGYKTLSEFVSKCLSPHSKDVILPLEENMNRYELSRLAETELSEDELEDNLINLLNIVSKQKKNFSEKIVDFLFDLSTKYDLFQKYLLRFFASLPNLKTNKEVALSFIDTLERIVDDHNQSKGLVENERKLPGIFFYIIKVLSKVLKMVPSTLVAILMKKSVKIIGKRFIAGKNLKEASESLKLLESTGRCATFDILGELVITSEEADQYRDLVLALIEDLGNKYLGEVNEAQIFKGQVSIKVSALCPNLDLLSFDEAYHETAPRLKSILLKGKEKNIFICIDAEHCKYRDIIFKIYKSTLLDHYELQDYAATGIVLQTYLKDSYPHFLEILSLARERRILMPIRLVKGAYWDSEVAGAAINGLASPQFLNKEETDIWYRQFMHLILENSQTLQLCVASHNFEDHVYAETLRKSLHIDGPSIEHQCLHMTCETLSNAMAQMGWAVRDYVPLGDMLSGMGYMIRRIIENSSQAGFLTKFREQKDLKKWTNIEQNFRLKRSDFGLFRIDSVNTELTSVFKKLPLFELLYQEKDRMNQMVKVINEQASHKSYLSFDESENHPNRIFNIQDKCDIKTRIDQLNDHFLQSDWSDKDLRERIFIFLKISNLILEKRLELSYLLADTTGLTLNQAFQEVSEGINYINFYARMILKELRSEKARGIAFIWPSGNESLSNSMALMSLNLMVGNSVLLYIPKENSDIFERLFDLFIKGGIPSELVIPIWGAEEVVGSEIAENDKISVMYHSLSDHLFSKLEIRDYKHFVDNKKYQMKIPFRVYNHSFGKNSVIITASASINSAIKSLRKGLFDRNGQGPFTITRFFVHQQSFEEFSEKLFETIKNVKKGHDPKFYNELGPNKNLDHQNEFRKLIKEVTAEVKEYEGKILWEGKHESGEDVYLEPLIVSLNIKKAKESNFFNKRNYLYPIIYLVQYGNQDEIINILNESDSNFQTAIYSESQYDIDGIISRIKSSRVTVNMYPINKVGQFTSGMRSNSEIRLDDKSLIKTSIFSGDHLMEEETMLAGDSDREEQIIFSKKENDFNYYQRVQKISKIIKTIIGHYELIFNGINENEKNILEDYRNWSQQYFSKKNPLRKVLANNGCYYSFSERIPTDKKLILIAHTERPHVAIILYFLQALSLGISLAIIAKNERVLKIWKKLRSLINQEGIDINTYLFNENSFESICHEQKVDYFLTDSNKEGIQKLSTLVLTRKGRSLITKYDYFQERSDFASYIEKLTYEKIIYIDKAKYACPYSWLENL